jgi:PAS domain S-box-containing protein
MTHKPTYEELEKRIEELESTQRINEAFFRKIIDLIPSCIIVKNRDGQFVLVNEKTATFYGPDIESMIGRYEYEYAGLHPSNQAEIEKFLADDRNVIDTGKSKTIPDEKFTTANGEQRIFHVSKSPISSFGYDDSVLIIATDITEQKKAEKNLQTSEKKYRTLFENVGEAIFLHDLGGNIVDVNPECCRLYGYSREQFIKMNLNQIDSPEDRQFYEERLKHLKEKGYVNFQAVHLNSNNKKIINECNVRLIDYSGKKMVLGITRDITERKLSEKLLRESEDKFRLVAENIPVLVNAFDENNSFVFWNKECEKVTGYAKSEIIDNPDSLNLLYPDESYLNHLVEEWKEKRSKYKDWEMILTCKDGKNIIISWTSVADIISIKGWASWAVGIDITERKQIEVQLLASKKEWEEIFQAIGHPAIIIDQNHSIIKANESTRRLTGMSENELMGKKCYEIFHNSKKHPESCPMEALIHSNSLKTVEMEMEALNGTFLVSCTPVTDKNGGIKNIIHIATDITELKRLEYQARNAQKMEAIGTLAGGIAHDFNNMLGVISGNVSYVLNIMEDEEDLIETLKDVQESVKQGTNLTRQLITFAKGGAPIKKTIALNDVIKDIAKLVLRGSASVYHFNLSEDLLRTEADEGQLSQVISNLLINAGQAMPEGGIIQIETKNETIDEVKPFPLPSGAYVSIKITDQGIGIPEKHLSKIFDPFFTTKQKGSGLGLTTSFSIISKHGGHIWVESIVGEGATFTIFLPAIEQTTSPKEIKNEAIHKGKGKLLIMDDQEPVIKMVGRMLGRMGYETLFAKEGAQAIDLYSEAFQTNTPFDLVILDLTVPGGMGGVKTIPELLKINPDAKVVVSSGYSNDPVMSDYQGYGFCGVLEKPYSSAQMAEVLNNILGEKH